MGLDLSISEMMVSNWWNCFKEPFDLQCRRPRFDPWIGKIPGGGNGNRVQYSCLENPKDRGAWRATVYSSPWGRSVGHNWVINTFPFTWPSFFNFVLAVQISHKQSSLCMCRPSVFRLACLNFWLVPKVIKFTFVFVDLLMQKLTRVSVLAQFLFLSCCSWTDLGQTFLSGLIHFPHLPTSQTHAHTLVSLEQVLSRPPRPGSP